jgi:hypothetical protein
MDNAPNGASRTLVAGLTSPPTLASAYTMAPGRCQGRSRLGAVPVFMTVSNSLAQAYPGGANHRRSNAGGTSEELDEAAVEENMTVVDQPIRRFDVSALYSALDDKRTELGISWTKVADQLWELSPELNSRRNDHPISPSTLTNMAKSPRTSCQHALFMLRWLGRTPESFLTGATGDDDGFALPAAGPDRRLRWSLKRLYAAMNEKRQEDGLTWSALAAILGCTPNQLTSLRTAKFATGMDLAMRIVQWLCRPAADFVYAATW